MFQKLWNYYFKNYKKILVVPIILAIIMGSATLYTKATTGEFFGKDVSLKGGYTARITTDAVIDVSALSLKFNADVRVIRDVLKNSVQAYELVGEEKIESGEVTKFFSDQYDVQLDESVVTVGFQSPAIAATFFTQATIAILMSFLLMGGVVFYYFRKPAPSLSIILSTLLDVVCVVGLMNLLSIKMSTASIGAILMIIGYSTDSDILLSTNIIKRKDKPLRERMLRAMKTEITVDTSAFLVFSTMFLLSNASMIREIALILVFGVCFDFINTWLGTATIQRMFFKVEE